MSLARLTPFRVMGLSYFIAVQVILALRAVYGPQVPAWGAMLALTLTSLAAVLTAASIVYDLYRSS